VKAPHRATVVPARTTPTAQSATGGGYPRPRVSGGPPDATVDSGWRHLTLERGRPQPDDHARSGEAARLPSPLGYPPAGFQERAVGPPLPSGGHWRGSTSPATRRAAPVPRTIGDARVTGVGGVDDCSIRPQSRFSVRVNGPTRVAEFGPRRRPAWLCLARTRRDRLVAGRGDPHGAGLVATFASSLAVSGGRTDPAVRLTIPLVAQKMR